MSKKPQYDPEEIRFPDQKIVASPLVSEMEKSYIEYAMSVIVGRALPDVRDGLKPVHRRILYAMYEDNLTADKPFKKSATCVGDVLGRYHPHGDQSVYDALVRLAQDFSMRYLLVEGHGNFGSVDGDPPAAYRYTEARLSKLSNEMLRDIDKETVDWDPNFDETRKEPKVLPSRFPNLLVNGSSGIAVGMATNIPPHNLREVIGACICVLDNPQADLNDLMEHIKGPDFPTRGIIMGRAGIRQAYATGRGHIKVRARTEMEEFGQNRTRIIVTEIRLAQDFSMRYLLVEGHGNFGSVDGDPPAAYRYTEARLSKLSNEMLRDIDKETVDWDPNFDETRKEPKVLPSRFPNLLVNGSSGIAVGMATNIPPHNLREVIGACICVLDNPQADLNDLMEHIKGPDFPTRGIIMGRAGIRQAYATGRGHIKVRARTEMEEFGQNRTRIIVTEISKGLLPMNPRAKQPVAGGFSESRAFFRLARRTFRSWYIIPRTPVIRRKSRGYCPAGSPTCW